MQLPANFGKYELLEFLGGGMSHVYRARDTVIDRTVVVKILTDQAISDSEAKLRFLQEARLAGNIQHENIVSVFDYGEHDGRPFIVMEYLKGEDLREAIRGARLGSMHQRLKTALDIAGALDYVHSRAIVHRDIKPENIHIDPNGRVKLMDFGIAKANDLTLTKTGMAMGTPYYMSPEQIAGGKSTNLVDVYAFGQLLFELMTGVRGVSGDTMEQVFFQILNTPVDLAAMEQAGAPLAVRELVRRCTAKKPEDRPQSFQWIMEELHGIMSADSGSRTQALPQTRVQTIPPPGQRAKMPFGVWIIAAVVVVFASVEIGLWWHRTQAPKPIAPAAIVQIPGMFYISAGTFLSGANNTPTPLKAFYIDETEVSNADYCRVTGCTVTPGTEDLPVVNIKAAEARAYAKQVGKRLPLPLEWERALRGANGALFPWGNQADPTKANVADNPSATHQAMPVRSFAGPPYNMIGNVWEMIEEPVTPSAQALAHFPAAANERWITSRGGSFRTPLNPAYSYDAVSSPESYSAPDLGFRCVKDP